MLTKLGWDSLAERQKERRLIMLYEAIHHLVDIKADSLLLPCPYNHSTEATSTGSYNYQQELVLMQIPFSQAASRYTL